MQNLRAADILRANREQAVTYWAAQQMWLSRNEKDQNPSMNAFTRANSEISSPEVSFIMNAAIRHRPFAAAAIGEKDIVMRDLDEKVLVYCRYHVFRCNLDDTNNHSV